jgi:hypothetical protein
MAVLCGCLSHVAENAFQFFVAHGFVCGKDAADYVDGFCLHFVFPFERGLVMRPR